jgi:hypothetical protein
MLRPSVAKRKQLEAGLDRVQFLSQFVIVERGGHRLAVPCCQ